jgi:hypothetical protein
MTDAVFEALKNPLALVEDEERRRAFERYVEAARFPLERAVFDLLSALVQAVDADVREHYRVRLAYHPGALELETERVASPSGTGQAAPSAEQATPRPQATGTEWTIGDGETEKVTIRLPAELKDLATYAASSAGLSANSWFVRALSRSLGGFADSEPRGAGSSAFPGGSPPPEPPTPPQHDEPRAGKRLQGWIGE